MQFSIIALLLSAAVAVSAGPAPVTSTENLGPHELAKRTCGTLTGTKLKICQDACKVTCIGATLGIARKLCEKACDAGPIGSRSVEIEATVSEEEAKAAVEAEVSAKAEEDLVSRGVGHKVCDGACDVLCNSTVLALEQLKCLAKCKAKC